LVLGQGLGREEVEGTAALLRQERLHHGYVIAESLAAGRGSGYHHVFAPAGMVYGLGLMGIEGQQAVPGEILLKDSFKWAI